MSNSMTFYLLPEAERIAREIESGQQLGSKEGAEGADGICATVLFVVHPTTPGQTFCFGRMS